VADYSRALAEALRPHAEVRLNPEGDSAGIDLYHIGNNLLHRPMYELALARPGAVVLHDAVLQHFFLGHLNKESYVSEFVYNYGEWNRAFGQTLWAERARSAHDERYFAWPMLRRIVEVSRAVVVHNPAAAAAVKRHAPDVPVHSIPHLFAPPPLPHAGGAETLRGKLGLGAGAFLFALMGHLRETKRVMPVLRVFSRIRQARPEAHLLVAGEFVSTDLERAAEPHLHAPGIIRRGYLSEEEFWLYASAADAVINLRYPSAGEASGIGIRLMGAGKPCIVTNGEEYGGFPAGCLFPVDHGVDEQPQLTAAMLWMLEQPLQARQMGAAARRHIVTHHNPSRVAQCYIAALNG
jgi:glycosyltransferase involved in cell wall biosynthesis